MSRAVTIRCGAPYRPTSPHELKKPTTSKSAVLITACESWIRQTVRPRCTMIARNRKPSRGRGSPVVLQVAAARPSAMPLASPTASQIGTQAIRLASPTQASTPTA